MFPNTATARNRQYSSVQNLATDNGYTVKRNFTSSFKLSPPPAEDSRRPPMSDQEGRNSDAHSETEDVNELRQQVRMLNSELRQMRSEFCGSMQHLHTIGNGMRSARHSCEFPSLHSVEEGGFKPPLPPRLYRPVKPRRTFAHGSTSIMDLPFDRSISSTFTLGSTPALNYTDTGGISDRTAVTRQEGQPTKPPLPPRLGTNQCTKRIPALPPPPPSLPPKPPCASNRNQAQMVNANASIAKVRQPSHIHHNGGHRPSHIHTNGSINGNGQNVLPPRYQRPIGYQPGQHLPAFAALVNNPCDASSPAHICGHPSGINTLADGNQKKVNLDLVMPLPAFSGDPLTHENVAQSLKCGFRGGVCWYKLGPVLLYLNPFHDLASPMTLSSLKEPPLPLKKLAKDIHRDFMESEVSQAVVFGGDRGSGKTYMSSQLVKALFQQFTYHNKETGWLIHHRVYQQFDDTVSLLRSLTSCRRRHQNYSSHAAYMYELHVANDCIYKAKTYCCFLDYHRLYKLPQFDSSFEIFYQMMAGLNQEEKVKFHLNLLTVDSLNYIKRGENKECGHRVRKYGSDQMIFQQFRSSLTALGIPFSDIIRILAAVLLLGDVHFVEKDDGEIAVENNNALSSAAALLGVTTLTLFKALSSKQRVQKENNVQLSSCASMANDSIASLAMTLYHRCVLTIIKKANTSMIDTDQSAAGSTRIDLIANGRNARPASGISSSDESSAHDSGLGMTKASTGTNSSSDAINTSTRSLSQGLDGVISVLDWFGFSNDQYNHFEQLCSNFAAVKSQQLYQSILFKQTEELAKCDGVEAGFEWPQFDSMDSCSDRGHFPVDNIFYVLNESCNFNGTQTLSFSEAVTKRHETCEHFRVTDGKNASLLIRHYGDIDVTYFGIDDFSERNRDILNGDLLALTPDCVSGSLSGSADGHARITPATSERTEESETAFSEDFSLQTEAFLRNISCAKVHFVQCIKPNYNLEYVHFDPGEVIRQCKRLDVLLTIRMMNSGLPHAITVKEFIDRYRFLVEQYDDICMTKSTATMLDEAQAIFDSYLRAVDDSNLPYVSNHWRIGTNYVFLSDGAKNQLDWLRDQHRSGALQTSMRPRPTGQHLSAPPAQNSTAALVAGWVWSKTDRSANAHHLQSDITSGADSDFSPPASTKTSPPPVPASRGYTVHLGRKINFPQERAFVENYTDASNSRIFHKNEIVTATGWGPSRNQLLVRDNSNILFDPKRAPVVVVPESCTRIC